MKNILNEIKYAYQRVIRGFDDRIYWEFDSYFSQFIPPLKQFCETELKNTENMEYNPLRKEVFMETLKLIKNFEEIEYKAFYEEINPINKLWSYFGKNIGYYWN